MSAPLPVQVVRPSTSFGESVARLVGRIAEMFLSALLVWWLAPDAFNWHPGYGTAVAAVVAVRSLLPTPGTSYLYWTVAGAAKKKATR